MNSEIVTHLLATFIYFLLIIVLRLVGGGLSELGLWGILGMFGGAVLGTFFLDIDHLIYWFITHPEKEDSKEAGEAVRGLKIGNIREKAKGLFILLKKVHRTHTRLIFHSVIGQIILLVLAFYLLTSGGSILGSAFIMSINLHLLKDEWQDYFKDKKHLIDWLFWQVRAEIPEKQLTVYLVIVSLVFLGMTGLLI